MPTEEVHAKVFTHPVPSSDYGELPQFNAMLGWADGQARRIPWWAWALGGYLVGSGLAAQLWQATKSVRANK